MVKIYTKTGDDGATCLVTGRRVAKDSLRVDAYGEVDELNSLLGLAIAQGAAEALRPVITKIQSALFDLGADLACPPNEESKLVVPRIQDAHVVELEGYIDRFETHLEPLRQFVLPGGSVAASYLHLARSVCRRAERRVVTLRHSEPVSETLMQYLNRLSDLLFVMARYQNAADETPEVTWTPSI
ncbi:MAG: cob(I)yrinic acid a,c-diamide adenosyltransferase [Candidatus Hinthialibacter antarcticus]|nr:cob(I)yrinic acid a,c-diamide adenosyltransferase [Candidatus Hinthialibacter antarcticus]